MTPPTATQLHDTEHEATRRRTTPTRRSRTAARSAHHEGRRLDRRGGRPRRQLPGCTPAPTVARGRSASAPNARHRDHAAIRALRSGSGIGAAVVECKPDWVAGESRWTALVTDGDTYRYVEVRSREVKPGRRLPCAVIEEGVERFAAGLPEPYRLHHLINACPLRLASDGTVFD